MTTLLQVKDYQRCASSSTAGDTIIMDETSSSTTLNGLPCSLLQHIANQYLNPMERSSLSCCNRRLHDMLPPLLQIVIAASRPRTSDTTTNNAEDRNDNNEEQHRPYKVQKIPQTYPPQTVLEEVFVTPIIICSDNDNIAAPRLIADTATTTKSATHPSLLPSYDRTLKASENLVFGTRYHFWKFDVQLGIPVFFGRHTRHAIKNNGGDDSNNNNIQSTNTAIQYRYSMAMRPYSPNQSWEVVPAPTSNDKTCYSVDQQNHRGGKVQWGENVVLSVGGEASDSDISIPNIGQPTPTYPRCADSAQRTYLSCLPLSSERDDLQRTRSNTEVSQTYTKWSWFATQGTLGPNECLTLLTKKQFERSSAKEPSTEHQQDTQKKFIVHAIPEACDEGEYFLFSPMSLRHGVASCDGYHVNVYFDHWIERGIMSVRAPVLPFTLSIPILECDYDNYDNRQEGQQEQPSSPLANLLHIKSARWGCLIYYMAVAADTLEGKTLDMDRFLRRVTDHPDHTVQINDARDLVHIDVRDKMVKLNAMDLPRRSISATNAASSASTTSNLASWCFLLSW